MAAFEPLIEHGENKLRVEAAACPECERLRKRIAELEETNELLQLIVDTEPKKEPQR